MDPAKPSTPEFVAAGAAVLLLVVMFLPWYGLSSAYGLGSASRNAWQAFGLIDVLLFLSVLVLVGTVVAQVLGRVPARLGQPPAVLIAGAALLCFVLVLFRVLFEPGLGALEIVSVSRRLGLYLAFLITLAMVWGGWTAVQVETAARSRR